ncbi:Uncharacterized protein K02A2.6 [Trichoplax sp. H2]|nr:Uncharacterized protein K02A2.6 [Trichoplax sp. H2]|eukprot:RDD37251.1 Uncharacterized protein K02A2.6 [Trichoplax sp. H2]
MTTANKEHFTLPPVTMSWTTGDHGEHKARGWGLTQDQLKDPTNVWSQLEKTVGKASNFRYERLKFTAMKQTSSEYVDEFHSRLKNAATHCYEFTLTYIPGQNLVIPDALSRLTPLPGNEITLSPVIHNITWSDHKLNLIATETQKDEELTLLTSVIQSGWPDTIKQCPKRLRKWWTLRDYLTLQDGYKLKHDQVIIPRSLHEDILSKLHTPHYGIEKTRALARTCVYWTGINDDIKNLIKDCVTCNTYINSL